MANKVIIDCDPGIDDILALLYAIKHPYIDVVGITVVSGNVNASKGVQNVFRLLTFLQVDIPVYIGETCRNYVNAEDTHGENGIGNYSLPIDPKYKVQPLTAPHYLAKIKYSDDISIIALGPLTNLKEAHLLNRDFYKRVKLIVTMGGNFKSYGNCTPVSEYNYWCDPQSAWLFYRNLPTDNIKCTMVGLDVTRKIVLTKNDIDIMKLSNKKIGDFVEGITNFYMDFHKKQEGIDGCVINDPLAVFAFLYPENFEMQDYYVTICTPNGGPAKGQSIIDEKDIYKKRHNAYVCTNVNTIAFWNDFITTIL